MNAGNIEDIYELSPLQQGMLFHTLFAPEAALYLEQFSIPWRGMLNLRTFTDTWKRVLDRHSALRTSFHWEDLQKPLQVVHRNAELPIEQLDWQGLPAAEQQARLEAYLADDRARGFVLSEAPLMRLMVIRWATSEYQLVLSVHHIVLDGWSLQIAFRDFMACYTAACEGREPGLEPCRPYGDYIGWLQQQDLSTAETFWRRKLEGFTAPTPLAVDEPAGNLDAVSEGIFDDQEIRLSAAATAGLQALAREHQLTLNTLVLGAWALLLHRYSGEDDVLFGTVVSGRPASLRGVDAMVGLFINTLVVRTCIRPETPVLEYLRNLQAEQSEAARYEYSPLVDVHGWSGVPRGTPLFESLIVFENYPVLHGQAPGASTTEGAHQPRHIERTNLPLTVIVSPGASLSVKILSSRNRFRFDTTTRLLRHYLTLLENTATCSAGAISELPIVTNTERAELLLEWNATVEEYPRDRCLHELFEAQALRTPDAAAVACEGERLTYRELDRRADRLARRLRADGVGPGVLVGVCVDRGLDMVVALLAVLKAGGAYLPLDPAYPQERLAATLEDAQAPVLLTQSKLLPRLPDGALARCIDLDEAIASEQVGNSPPSARPDDPAYVIYTSGSTGRPKGVQIPHRAVVNFLSSMQKRPGLTARDTVLAVTTIAFDIAVLELFLPLTVGGRVELATREVAADGSRLAELLATGGISAMQATPATWRLLLDAGWKGTPGLKILCGGEALPWELAGRLLPMGGSLWNLYGPTETTVWSTVYRVEAAVQTGSRYVPIGRPIANTQVYVLDQSLQPVPCGVPGELYIGGDGVACGYLGDPDLTGRRFLRNPFVEDPQSRLYRTGDRVRYVPEGDLEYLGRTDCQVKIRGFRVEPGEIEAALGSRNDVSECVVVAREDTVGDRRLVAYVTGNGRPAPSVSECRRFLENRLPAYMVPGAFVTLDRLPRTSNGKVDRRALPPPDAAPNGTRTYVAPRTSTEGELASLFAEVLGAKQVGVHDDFFADLGGHSLLATQLISRIRGAFGIDIPLRTLFELPTVSALAASIETLRFPGLEASAASGRSATAYEEGEL